MNELLPYANRGETISISLDFPGVAKTDLGEHSVMVDATKLRGSITVTIDAQLPNGFESVFPSSETADPPLAVLAAVKSIDGSIRTHFPLKKSKKNLYGGVIQLDPTIVTDSADVCVYAVRTKQGSKAAGFTSQKGARLAWSPVHEIRLRERPPPKGSYLRIEWVHFDQFKLIPNGFDNAFYYIDTSSDEPVLYLNRNALPSLVKLVDTKGYGHRKALLRDTIFGSIAVSVWASLVRTALEALRQETFPIDFQDTFSGKWEGEVLKWLAPRAFPNMLPGDALDEFCRSMDQDQVYSQVLTRTQLAIQSEHDLIRTYGKSAEEAFSNG